MSDDVSLENLTRTRRKRVFSPSQSMDLSKEGFGKDEESEQSPSTSRIELESIHSSSRVDAEVQALCLRQKALEEHSAGDDTCHLFRLSDSLVDIGDTLGRGTVARVVSVSWLGLSVAVKMLRPLHEIMNASTREHALNDFVHEMQINMILGSHPNVVMYLGTCALDNVSGVQNTGIVFENVGNDCGPVDVKRLCANRRRDEALKVALGVARALLHAHHRGVMHRDIKPSNVLVTSSGDAKLADWGLATTFPGGDMSPRTGTIEFMAPEIYLGKPYGPKADVFSFGIFLYALVTGFKYPYENLYLSPAQAAEAAALKQLRPSIPKGVEDELSAIMNACWEENPEKRPDMQYIATVLHSIMSRRIAQKEQDEGARNGKSWGSWFG